MNASSTIAPHILALSLFLSVTWGIYLIFTVRDYLSVRTRAGRERGDLVASFRRMLVAICVFSLPASFVFRTVCVLAGVGDDLISQILFFALVGPNVVCSLFAVISLRYD